MEAKRNLYQLSKTIRFGLTLKNKIWKNGKEGYCSHSELRDLVKVSEKRVHDSVPAKSSKDMKSVLKSIIDCTANMKQFMSDWKKVSLYHGQIELDKDYYKMLAKKIGFNGKKKSYDKEKNVVSFKMPSKQNIPLNQLSFKDEKGDDPLDRITSYWKHLFISAEGKWREASEQQSQFESAIKLNRDDHRPNEIELKKTFLAFASIVKEMLCPIINGQIMFARLDKLDSSRQDNQFFLNFVTDNSSKSKLLAEIDLIKAYFNDNGGNVPYCRATLCEKTALKDKNSTVDDNDISGLISKLQIDTIIREYNSADDFMNSIYNSLYKEKNMDSIKKLIDDEDQGLVKRALMYKYTPIPSNVRRDIAKVLSVESEKTEEDIFDFLRDLGFPRSPQKDYADLKDKSEFNIESYPLKVAFDFAWEGVARSIYHDYTDFPKDVCQNFLSTYFGVQMDTKELRQYADMLELNALLSTLDNNNSVPADQECIIGKVTSILEKFNKKGIKDFDRHKKNIENHINDIKKEFERKKEAPKAYDDTKRDIAMQRGQLKNDIKNYKELSESNKKISPELGKKYASMRDKIMKANEHNCVSHFALIVEDANSDRYLLLQKITEDEKGRIFRKLNNKDGLTAYYVNSITSSATAKMIRKHDPQDKTDDKSNLSDTEKEEQKIKQWTRFISKDEKFKGFQLNLKDKNLEQIKKEVDSKCYALEKRFIDVDTLKDLVMNGDCLLFPLVNQDVAKEVKTENNQFTKDWNAILSGMTTSWRLTPEFSVSYRHPVPNYPKSDIGDKRYSRFQMNVHFLCDFIPQTGSYCSNREQIQMFKDEEQQQQMVRNFNNALLGMKVKSKIEALSAKFGSPKKKEEKKSSTVPNQKFYVFGIDRGQKELATLCVIDQDRKIIGNHKIYTRQFNHERKQWEHKFYEERHILDLSNLRVETTIMIDGKPERKQVLVDQSKVSVKDKDGNNSKPNKLQIKMQQMGYIRKLQYQMQTNREKVLKWYEDNQTDEKIIANLVDKENGEKGLISFYGCAILELKDTLPLQKIKDMLNEFKSLCAREDAGEDVHAEMNKLVQLEPVDNFKAGVVANMVGVIAFLLKEFDYQAYISLEDLSKKFNSSYSGISGMKIHTESGRQADVERYSGLGLYNFFEMQLLRKLLRIQQDSNNVLHLVPTFRAQKNYDHVAVGQDKVKNQFGIVFFVDADQTSIRCPNCDANNKEKKLKPKIPSAVMGPIHTDKGISEGWVDRDKQNKDKLHCYACGFDTEKEYTENPLKYIKSGDDNAAFLISTSAIKAYELATTVADERNNF